MNKTALLEAIKEVLRIWLLSFIPLLIEIFETGTLDPKALLLVLAISLLRAIDKYIHLNEPAGIAGGLTRF